MSAEVEQYRQLINYKLDRINTDIHSVERDVDADLNRMIEERGTIQDGKIQEKLLYFKEGNRTYLIRSKRKALDSAKKRLTDLLSEIDFLAGSLSGEQLTQTIP